jgi:hypothetical protein
LGKGKAVGFHSCADGFAVCRAGVHPAKARRIAANIAKLPELMQRLARSRTVGQLIHTIGDNGRELRSLLAQFRVLRNVAFNTIASAL